MGRAWAGCVVAVAWLALGVGGAAAASGPTGSFTIDHGAAMTNSFVSIQYQASGPNPISLVYASNSPQTSAQGQLACGGQWPYGETIPTWTLVQEGCAPSRDDGEKTVYVQFVDTQGNFSPVYSQQILFDTTGPLWTQDPQWAFHTPQTVSAKSVKLDASWATSDLTAVTSNAELSTDAGATWSPAPLSSPRATTFGVTAAYKTPVQLTVSPLDALENYSIPQTLAGNIYPQLFDQTTSALVTWKGGWKQHTSTTYIGGTDRAASSPEATVRFTFSGRIVSFVTTTGPTRGIVNVAVDGTPAGPVDLWSAGSGKNRRVVWSHTFAADGTHTLTLTVAGTEGRPRVDIDAFLVSS